MIASEAFKRTQRAQTADWHELTGRPAGETAVTHGAAVAAARRNPWGLAFATVALAGGGVEAVRDVLVAPAAGAGPAVARVALVLVFGLAALLGLRYLLFATRGRIAVTAGRLSRRGPLRERSWPADEVTRVVALNTATTGRPPSIHYLFLGEARALVYASGSRFGLDQVDRVAAAVGRHVEAVREPVTVRHLLDVKNGRATLPAL